jgi:cytidine deaminase
VVYVEPYPKSLAKELYSKEIQIDCDTDSYELATRFEPFVGIAPRNYLRLFSMLPRKDSTSGYVIDEHFHDSIPRYSEPYSGYHDAELALVAKLVDDSSPPGGEKIDV